MSFNAIHGGIAVKIYIHCKALSGDASFASSALKTSYLLLTAFDMARSKSTKSSLLSFLPFFFWVHSEPLVSVGNWMHRASAIVFTLLHVTLSSMSFPDSTLRGLLVALLGLVWFPDHGLKPCFPRLKMER
jgi:hypothetical protein